MSREKKKLTHKELENHVVDWFVDRIYHEREVSNAIIKDKTIPDDEKEFILSGVADNLENIRELVYPIHHDEIDLVEWIDDFLDEYQRPGYDQSRN